MIWAKRDKSRPINPWVPLVFALGSLGLFAHFGYQNWRFTGVVNHVSAEITDIHVSTTQGRHGTSYHYHISYNYSTPQGSFFCSTTVEAADYHFLQVGGEVPVKYLAADPIVSRVDFPAEDAARRSTVYLFGVISLVMGIASAFSFWRRKSQRRTLRRGDNFN